MVTHVLPRDLKNLIDKPVVFRVLGSDRQVPGYIIRDADENEYIFVIEDPYLGWSVMDDRRCLRRLHESTLSGIILPKVAQYTGWCISVIDNTCNYYNHEKDCWKIGGVHISILATYEVKERIINKKYRWQKRK